MILSRLALGLLAIGAAPPVTPPGPFDYDTVEIAPNIYGFFEKQLTPIVSGNIIAVIGRDAVLVFDTGHRPTITRRIISDLRKLTTQPVRYVVVSHWYDDHFAGNAEFAKAYPGVQIIAHEFTAKLLESRKDGFRGAACRKDIVDSSKPLRAMLATGKRADFSAAGIRRAMSSRMCPTPRRYSRVMDVARLVPGHGPVMNDMRYVRDVAEVLESISRQAKAAYAPGMTADQLREKIDLSELSQRFSHGDSFIKANFDFMMKGPAVDRMWQELTGQWKPEGV